MLSLGDETKKFEFTKEVNLVNPLIKAECEAFVPLMKFPYFYEILMVLVGIYFIRYEFVFMCVCVCVCLCVIGPEF